VAVRRQDRGRAAEDELLAELRQIFDDTDALQHGTSCPASTECCRFGVTGREPYVTSIEVRAVERAVAANGGPLSKRRRALPLAGQTSATERTCPLLNAQGQCSIYAWRPFGCRTFFCERATRSGPLPRKEERELVRRLAELAARHEPDGDKVRALTQVFGAAP
jgi:Fe-S-cluster containining protein